MRNKLSGHRRGIARSIDGGRSFGKVTFDKGLPEPVCMASVLYDEAEAAMFFANPGQTIGRVNGGLRRSDDDGKTWQKLLTVAEGLPYSYSCLVSVPIAGQIGLLWETSLPGGGCSSSSNACHILFSLLPTTA
jgi:hypothetical protein